MKVIVDIGRSRFHALVKDCEVRNTSYYLKKTMSISPVLRKLAEKQRNEEVSQKRTCGQGRYHRMLKLDGPK